MYRQALLNQIKDHHSKDTSDAANHHVQFTVSSSIFGRQIKFAVIYLKFKQRPNLSVFCQKDENGIANSEDPDQTASRSSLIWVCTVCPDLSVRKLRIIMVSVKDYRTNFEIN